VHLVGFHYTSMSQCTVLRMSKSVYHTLQRNMLLRGLFRVRCIRSTLGRPRAYLFCI